MSWRLKCVIIPIYRGKLIKMANMKVFSILILYADNFESEESENPLYQWSWIKLYFLHLRTSCFQSFSYCSPKFRLDSLYLFFCKNTRFPWRVTAITSLFSPDQILRISLQTFRISWKKMSNNNKKILNCPYYVNSWNFKNFYTQELTTS